MADSCQQTAIELLPDVLNLLLDPTKQLTDDTWIEKLLSWLKGLASNPVSMTVLLHSNTGILEFIKKSCSSTCDLAGLTFALKVSAVLLDSISSLVAKDQSSSGTYPHNGMESNFVVEDQPGTCPPNNGNNTDSTVISVGCSHNSVHQLTLELLVSAYKSTDWQQASLRNAWLIAARRVVSSSCPETFASSGMLKTAYDSLKDNCMFIVSSAQQLLAAFIASTHSCCKEKHAGSTQCVPSIKSISHIGIQQSLPKCRTHLVNCLHNLIFILRQISDITGHNTSTELVSVTIGVFKSLLMLYPDIGHMVLAEFSIAPIILETLESSSNVSRDLCTAVVEFVEIYLQTFHRCSLSESQFLCSIMNLPVKMLHCRQYGSAFHLASVLYRCVQSSNINDVYTRYAADEGLQNSSMLLELVQLPIDCLHHKPTKNTMSSALSTVQISILQDLTANKYCCVTVMCFSLSALGDMLVERFNDITADKPILIDDMTSLLGLTLGQPSHDHICLSALHTHLSGSLKLTKAVLLVLKIVVTKIQGSPSEPIARQLLHQLGNVLNNPASDPTVINKCLEVLALVLAMFDDSVTDPDNTMKLLADIITKRSYDPRWEVRDSVMSFIGSLLHTSSGFLHAWVKCHCFHVRISECINDGGDSYVRATAIDAIIEVARHHSLWTDMLELQNTTQGGFVNKLINIVRVDSQGFARRSAVRVLTQLLTTLPGLHQSLLLWYSGQFSCDDLTTGQDCQDMSLVLHIISGLSAALFDLDWEVKLSALEFYETAIELCLVPCNHNETVCTEKCTGLSDKNTVQPSPTALQSLRWLLNEQQLLRSLKQVLKDEDRTVALRACQLLLKLKCMLHAHQDSPPDLELFAITTYQELERLSLESVQTTKMVVVDGYEYHPVSLLQDILRGSYEVDANSLDCY